jgi:hypothetical protein
MRDRTTRDVEMFERLFQITHPSLCRVFVVMVKETDLSDTARDVGVRIYWTF